MFHLTPQEKNVLIGFLTVCFLGAVVNAGIHYDAKPLQWLKTSSQKLKRTPPDINKSSAKSIDAIDGIGPKTALRIVQYRQAHGPFASIDDLLNVKGITKKNLVKIKVFFNQTDKAHGDQ